MGISVPLRDVLGRSDVDSAGFFVGQEISVFSPVGMARAAAIPVGALEAGDLMGETPRTEGKMC